MRKQDHFIRGRCAGGRATGSALVITLAMLVLVTILVVGTMTTVRLERVSASSNFESRRAKSLAMLGVDNAAALIRTATENGTQAGKFWASQPGKITVFSANGTEDVASSRFLYSTNAGNSTVDLNQAGFEGVAPIASANSLGTNVPPAMPVSWESVLQDPSAPASATNRIVGRYAFWVDDESAKLNVNTADGTAKNTTNSFGPGTPTDVSLTALKTGGANIATTNAVAISTRSGARYTNSAIPRPFNDPSEILQASGVSTNLVADNNFNLTHYSRSPELNIFGEPKINLILGLEYANGAVLNAMLGPYGSLYGNTMSKTVARNTDSTQGLGLPLNSIYPLARQLPAFTAPSTSWAPAVSTPLPQSFTARMFPPTTIDEGWFGTIPTVDPSRPGYELGMRIARYLKGFNSQGTAIQWPAFPGAGAGGFAAKYTDRQIDSMALQILGMIQLGTFADQLCGYASPYIMERGFLSGKLVRGNAPGPRLNEITIVITTASGSPPKFNMQVYLEWYFPKEFQGALANSYAWTINSLPRPLLNWNDYPGDNASLGGGYWMDNMITALDQNGNSCLDFFGHSSAAPDPDPRSGGGYGTGPYPYDLPILRMHGPTAWFDGPLEPWKAGQYSSSANLAATSFYSMKNGTTSIRITGGLAIKAITQAGHVFEAVPLDSLASPAVKEAVLPFPAGLTIPVPGDATIHMQVADPLVNSFPGDWVVTVDPPAANITMLRNPGRNSVRYPTTQNIPSTYDGRNTIAKPDVGADPQSIWMPPQSDFTRPKSQRFPSAGYLQYLRTGLMPDKEDESKPLAQQKGTPYRALNFSPSTDASQRTRGGASYPDWAMLDLFTTPAVFQPLGSPLPAAVPLTWGGATAGRINPNSRILPFDSVVRRTPLESVFKGVQVSTSYDAAGNPVVSTSADETALASAINTYLAGLGRPFMLPGEICNVPEVANSLYAGGTASSKSRNDLVRQIVGNLSTRSNTFSIWAIGQVIKKAAGNTDYGAFQTGDAIAGESKWNVLIERRLDFGADGIPGNSQNPGADGVVGTPDDPVDPVYHPAMTYPLPYKYRVISAREVTN